MISKIEVSVGIVKCREGLNWKSWALYDLAGSRKFCKCTIMRQGINWVVDFETFGSFDALTHLTHDLVRLFISRTRLVVRYSIDADSGFDSETIILWSDWQDDMTYNCRHTFSQNSWTCYFKVFASRLFYRIWKDLVAGHSFNDSRMMINYKHDSLLRI